MRTRLHRERTNKTNLHWYEINDWMTDSYVNPFDKQFWYLIWGYTIVWYIIWPTLRAFRYMGLMNWKYGDYWWNAYIIPLGEQNGTRRMVRRVDKSR